MASVAQQAPEVKAAREFLNRLFGDANEGYLVVFSLPEKSTVSFDLKKTNAIDKAVQKAFEFCEEGQNAYFCLSAQGKAEVRKNENAIGIPGMWAELDVKGGGFKSTEQAMEFIDEVCAKELKLQPTILVSSGGGGFHAYWLFKEFWMFDGKAEQQKGAALVGRFQQLLRQKAREWGAALDSTADLSRVYRVPGTKNFKYDEPREVRVRQVVEGALYTPDTIEAVVEGHLADDGVIGDWKPSGDWDEPNLPDANAERILAGCPFIQHCKEDAETLPEPDWYKMINILSYCENGQELAHEWSRAYPGYSYEETQEKFERAREASKPFTCQKIWEDTGGEYCRGCEHNKVIRSPIKLGMPSREELAARKADELIDTIKGAESPVAAVKAVYGAVDALAVLQQSVPEKYAVVVTEIKELLGDTLNKNDLTRAVKRAAKKRKNTTVVEDQPQTLDEDLPDIPVKGLKKPKGYVVTETGVKKLTMEGGAKGITPVPVVIARRLKDVDSGKEKLELMQRRDGSWQSIFATRDEVYTKSKLQNFASNGLWVHDGNAGDLVRYFAAFEEANLDMPPSRSVVRLGWVDHQYDAFFPGAGGDVVFDPMIDPKGVETKGDLETWKAAMEPVLARPIPRFVLAASFASPLLRLIGSRTFLVYIYGPSRGGKTASIMAALSAWGEPNELMADFNGTKVAIERKAAFLSDLPLGIDERQVAGDKQGFIDGLVYMFGLGRSRARGTKDGGLREIQRWHNLALATGEQPISSDNSTAGIKTRTLEIWGQPFDDEEVAADIYQNIREAYGVAGPEYIRQVIELGADALRETYDRLAKALKERHPNNINSHIHAVAAVLLGDLTAQTFLWGVDPDKAEESALELGAEILAGLEKKDEVDDAKRAYEAFNDWLNEKERHFQNWASVDNYGFFADEGTTVCMTSTKFGEVLRDLGFPAERIKREWAERGWILPGDGKRLTKKRYNPILKTRPRVLTIVLETKRESGEDDELLPG